MTDCSKPSARPVALMLVGSDTRAGRMPQRVAPAWCLVGKVPLCTTEGLSVHACNWPTNNLLTRRAASLYVLRIATDRSMLWS